MENFRMRDILEEERPRERLMHYGVQVLATEELIALLLGSGNPGENAVNLGQKVLRALGDNQYEAPSLELLTAIKGVGPGKASRIIAGIELGRRIAGRRALSELQIRSPETVAKLFYDEFEDENREHLLALLLNTKHRIIGREKISIGHLNQAPVHPREVFRPAVRRSAHAIILVHNHPSGDPTPSSDDIAITRRLVSAGELLGIQVLDHIVIGDRNYISLKEKNYF